MSNDDDTCYGSAAAVEAAIKNAAQAEHGRDAGRSVDDLIRQAHFDRFLSRIFSDPGSEWVLKGGSAMLARIPSTRRTLDMDLFRNGYDAEESLEELKRLAAVDLHDFFRFEFVKAIRTLEGDNQPYADGYRVTFAQHLGVKRLENINIDLVAHTGAPRSFDVMEPGNRLPLARLETHAYRLYPLPDQLADKICAITETVGGRRSTRVKDLVDAAIIASTQRLDGPGLAAALRGECARRRMAYPVRFEIPGGWTRAQFARLASGTTAGTIDLREAETIVRRLLAGLDTPIGDEPAWWNPDSLRWER